MENSTGSALPENLAGAAAENAGRGADSLSEDARRAVAELLGEGRVVGYRPCFASALGGAVCAVLLSQFWFWANTETVQGREEGWFWKPQKEITAETGLTRRETETARRRLASLGVLHEDLRGVPATLHFRLDKARLYALLWKHVQAQTGAGETGAGEENAGGSQFARNRQTGLSKPAKLVCTDAPNLFARTRQTIPEKTSKKTHKKTQPPVSPAALSEKTSEKTEGQRRAYTQGAAKLKAALDAARKGQTGKGQTGKGQTGKGQTGKGQTGAVF